jgi:hypothetical protein
MRLIYKILIRLGLVLGAVLALLLIANSYFVWATGIQLQEQLTTLREAKDPVTLKDLAQPAVPPEKNAFVFLCRAEAGIEAINKELRAVYDKEPPNEGGRLTPKEQSAVLAAWDAYPQVLPLLRQAAACPAYQPDLDYTVGLTELSEVISKQQGKRRELFRALQGRVRLLSARGEQEEALRTCTLMFCLARHMEKEPTLINYLVTLACRAMSIQVANEVLRSGPVPDAARKEFEAELARNQDGEGFRYGLKSERAYGLEVFETQLLPEAGWLGGAFFRFNQVSILRMYQEQLALIDKPYAQFAKVEARWKAEKPGWFSPNTFTRLLFPAVAKTREARERVLAQVRCLAVFSTLQRTAKAEGELKLADLKLSAEITTDPFTGDPLRIKKVGGQWVVYSVGQDLKDDGGDVGVPSPGKDLGKDVGVGPVRPEEKKE